MRERGQKESGRRLFLSAGLAVCLMAVPAVAQDLDPGGLTFRDFATNDNGASFSRGDPMIAGGPNQVPSRVVAIDAANGLARVQFGTIRVELSVPLGWQATEDWERGVAFSSDKRFRLLIWRVDFPFEGVKDAEHYAATKIGTIQSRRPSVKAQARKLADGTYVIVYENVAKGQGDSEGRMVIDVLRQNPGNPKEGLLITLGMPAREASRGMQLMALIKKSMKINW
ncbi:hypothetical protein BH11PSE3_BH11PSE3_05220 [soil metagenome]